MRRNRVSTRARRAIIRQPRSSQNDAMINLHEEYLVDEAGNPKAVVLPLAAWQRIKEELEELDDIRAYDEAKAQSSEPVPFEEALREILEGRLD